jgi:hypothetical protein
MQANPKLWLTVLIVNLTGIFSRRLVAGKSLILY